MVKMIVAYHGLLALSQQWAMAVLTWGVWKIAKTYNHQRTIPFPSIPKKTRFQLLSLVNPLEIGRWDREQAVFHLPGSNVKATYHN